MFACAADSALSRWHSTRLHSFHPPRVDAVAFFFSIFPGTPASKAAVASRGFASTQANPRGRKNEQAISLLKLASHCCTQMPSIAVTVKGYRISFTFLILNDEDAVETVSYTEYD